MGGDYNLCVVLIVVVLITVVVLVVGRSRCLLLLVVCECNGWERGNSLCNCVSCWEGFYVFGCFLVAVGCSTHPDAKQTKLGPFYVLLLELLFFGMGTQHDDNHTPKPYTTKDGTKRREKCWSGLCMLLWS